MSAFAHKDNNTTRVYDVDFGSKIASVSLRIYLPASARMDPTPPPQIHKWRKIAIEALKTPSMNPMACSRQLLQTSTAERAELDFYYAATCLWCDDGNPPTLFCRPFESHVVTTRDHMGREGFTARIVGPGNSLRVF
jgi:hypothetical protein